MRCLLAFLFATGLALGPGMAIAQVDGTVPDPGPFACDAPAQVGTLVLGNCQDSAGVVAVQMARYTTGVTAGEVDLMATNYADLTEAEVGSIRFIGTVAHVSIPSGGAVGLSNGSLARMSFTVTANDDGSFAVTRDSGWLR